jgi:hypothetical protein
VRSRPARGGWRGRSAAPPPAATEDEPILPQAFRAAGHVPGDPTAWPEAYVEPGFGGVANLWGSDAYLYGAWTYLVSSRLAKGVFTTDPTVYGAVEKSCFGVLVGRKGGTRFLDVSVGRRDFECPATAAGHARGSTAYRPIVADRFPIAKFQEAFDVKRSGQSGRVVPHWATSEPRPPGAG